MRENGKLGDQHKVPRVMNDRAIASALLAEVRAAGRRGAGAPPAEARL
jgi:hypothetical protein